MYRVNENWSAVCECCIKWCGDATSVMGVLDEPYSAKPAQLSSHTAVHRPARLHKMDSGNGTNLCRLACLYGYSAERG